MKKIMLAVVVIGMLSTQVQAAEHPVVGKVLDTTVSTTKRVVRFPLALVESTFNTTIDLIVNNPVREAWGNTK